LIFGGNLYYIFVFGLDDEWVEYVIISRQSLNDLRVNEGIGTAYAKGKKTHLKLTFSFTEAAVKCGGVVFDPYRNAWGDLPNAPEARGVLPQSAAGQPIHTSAQTAVISKLLRMGCNAASVEVDKILAFQDEEAGFTHIRVKGANGIAGGEPGAYTAEVTLPLTELKSPSDVFYVFPFHFKGRYADFIVISRGRLDELRLTKAVGSEFVDENTGKEYLRLAFSLSRERVTCGGEDFGKYRNAWPTPASAA
jgi:hypothetical protein